MRKLWVIMLFFGFVSCDLFVSKNKKTQELVNQEIQEIDWNEVDNYPLFENCDETQTKSGQKECFEGELVARCSQTLSQYEYVLNEDTDPNVQVEFLVDQNGKISILDIKKDPAIDDQMPEFNQIVSQGLQNLPPLAPALKRGIPVKAKFRIPIVLK